MSFNTYMQGTLVRVRAAFTNAAGVAIDPAGVICSYKPAAGTTVTKTYGADVEVVKDSVGNYHLDINANASGAWIIRWYSTGVGQTAQESQILVLPSAL